MARWLDKAGVDVALLPRIVEHRDRVGARPATVRALSRYPQ